MTRSAPFLLILALAVAGCKPSGPRVPPGELHGIGVSPPIQRPDFTLLATDGKPFNFLERTKGKLTFLFFGYTNCPDQCPVHAANIAAALRPLSWDDKQRVMFVFVTTDPDRDSLPALKAWLAHFDSSFVGLWGTADDVNRVLFNLKLPGSQIGAKEADGSYGVGHAGPVIAFEPDGPARYEYLFGIRQEHWMEDIPRLLAKHPK